MGRLLVDGMNVLGARPDGWWRDRDAAVAALVEHLAEWAATAGEEVTAVFDGDPPSGLAPGRHGALVVEFTGRGSSADDEIVRRLGDDPHDTAVVTSDGALAARVRAQGAAVMGAGGFRRRLGGEARRGR